MRSLSLLSAVENVLQQGCTLLKSVSNVTYTRRQDGPHTSSLGAHYRHVLDHFVCLLEGLEMGQINYDQRRRNREIENSSVEALFATEELIRTFHGLSASDLERDCECIVLFTR